MSSVIEVSKEYRLIALNPLCPACVRIINWRNEHPEIEVKHPKSFLMGRSRIRIMEHTSHLEIIWRGKRGGSIVK